MASKPVERPKTPPLPNGMKPLEHQVAGHKYGKGRTKLGFLQCGDGTILKPVQSPPRGERELNFYQQVFDNKCTDPVLLELRPLMPTYLQTWSTPENPGVLYFRMADVAYKYKKPCIADIKIGPVTWDPEATPEKIAGEKAKYPPVKKIGFQLLGLRVYNPFTDSYQYYNKDYCRTLDETKILNEGLGKFFHNGRHLRSEVIQQLLEKLLQVEEWFENQRQLLFFASSLLLVYEGQSNSAVTECVQSSPQETNDHLNKSEPIKNNNDVSCDGDPMVNDSAINNGDHDVNKVVQSVDGKVSQSSCVDIRMIDFAHVFPAHGARDDNYLTGLKSLIKHMQRLLV